MRMRDCNTVVPAVPSRPRSSGFMRNGNWKDSVKKMCKEAAEEVTGLTRFGIENGSTKDTVVVLVVKMATVLKVCTTEKQRSVVLSFVR